MECYGSSEAGIVDPGASYAIRSSPGGPWILPDPWKTLLNTQPDATPHRRVSHRSLDGDAAVHRLHRPGDISLTEHKTR